MTKVPWEGTTVKSKKKIADRFQHLHIRLEQRQKFWKFAVEKGPNSSMRIQIVQTVDTETKLFKKTHKHPQCL